MISHELLSLPMPTNLVSRYEMYCTRIAVHGCVTPPRKGTTLPRTRQGQAGAVKPLKRLQLRSCRALPYTALHAHYTSSNYRT